MSFQETTKLIKLQNPETEKKLAENDELYVNIYLFFLAVFDGCGCLCSLLFWKLLSKSEGTWMLVDIPWPT